MFLCLDVGGTAVKLGLLNREGEIRRKQEVSVSFDHYETPILTTVLRAAKAFAETCGEAPEGVAVSATGQVDDRRGVVIGTNGSIPGYDGTDFQATLREAFAVPVHVLNDANAAVLGEPFAGRARGCENVLMVTLGTGVGGGILSGGRLIRGRVGIAGELGHFSIDRQGIPCSCGSRGCFERYASTTALLRMAREAVSPETLPDGRSFFEQVASNPVLSGVLSQWIDQVALGLAGLIHIFNPEIVLIGGGVSAQEELLIRPLRQRVLNLIMPRFADGLRLEAASLGNDAGMIGALKFWLDQEGHHDY